MREDHVVDLEVSQIGFQWPQSSADPGRKMESLYYARRIRTVGSRSATFLLASTRDSGLASLPRRDEETDRHDPAEDPCEGKHENPRT